MILNDIMTRRRKDLEELKERFSVKRLRRAVEHQRRKESRSFKKALTGSSKPFNLICEIKKASPSEGVLREDFQPLRIAEIYEHAGAAAISVLTEPHFFKGRPSYLKTIRQVTTVPLLRKDFLFESYQIYESALLEADAFLLITSLLTLEELRELIALGERLGMEALVEVHADEDLKKAIDAGAKIIGVNNRNLKTLEVDPLRAKRMIPHIPKGIVRVVESGLSSTDELTEYRGIGADAFLIGSALMKSRDMMGEVQALLGTDRKWRKVEQEE